MKYRMICAALAVCTLLSGCSSVDVEPDRSADQHNSDLMLGLVTNTGTDTGTPASGGIDPIPEEIGDANSEGASSSGNVPEESQPSVTVPTAEVTTTPDADSDFNIFYSEVYEQFLLSDEELSFVDYSLFVGDSICSGFSEYGIVSRDHVAAKGNLGSRSFFDYTFKFRGKEEQTYAQVLKTAKPRYVFLSMGMNDVNMVYEDTYCENYRKVIQATLDGSKAEVFVAAITPVCSDFCANSVIDSFNDTIKQFIKDEFPERVHYFDFGRYLKNEQGKLRTCLHSGDGVHLGPYCYYIALWEMHRALMEAGLWDGTAPIGTFEEEEPEIVTVPEVTTTKPTKPKETKPSHTTAKTTQPKPAETTKPQTTKPATTSKTTKPEEVTEPVEVTDPVEIPQTSAQPTESAGETPPESVEEPPSSEPEVIQ